MFGLRFGELTILLLTTLIMPLLTLLLVVFIVYRFWRWLKQRDEDKRAVARTRFPVDAAEDLNDRVLWGSGPVDARGGAEAGPGVDARSDKGAAATPGAAEGNQSSQDGRRSAQASGCSGEEKHLAAPADAASSVDATSRNVLADPASSAMLARIALRGQDEALTARGLSERERVVLRGACDGKTFAVLSEELGVSRSTVGTYCSRAYEKLGVSSKEAAKAELARLTRRGLLVAAGLSDREAEVAVLAAEGVSTSDIAAALVLSEATVSSHLQQAYAKLKVHSRTELAKLLEASTEV